LFKVIPGSSTDLWNAKQAAMWFCGSPWRCGHVTWGMVVKQNGCELDLSNWGHDDSDQKKLEFNKKNWQRM